MYTDTYMATNDTYGSSFMCANTRMYACVWIARDTFGYAKPYEALSGLIDLIGPYEVV